MGLRKEVIRIHGGGQHGRKRPRGLIRFDGGSQHDHVGVNVQLPVVQQIGGLHLQLAVFGRDLADHALDVMYAVLLDGSAVELVKVLAGGAHVDIEHIYICIRVFFAAEHGMLRRVHAADLGAVGLALLHTVAAGADALDEDDGLRMCPVGRAQERAARGAGGVHETLKFEAGNDVRALAVSKFVEFGKIDGVEARRGDDGAIFLLNERVGLLVIDCPGGTDLRAHAALAVFEHAAVVGIDGRNLRHGLRKRDIDRAAIVHTEVKFVWNLLLRTLFRTQTAAGADVLLHKARFAADFHMEVADKAADGFNLGIGIDVDFFVLRTVNHFRCQDARRAVECRERLVDLGHLAADGRLLFDDIDLKASLGNVQCRLDARDAAADDERTLGDRAGTCGQRRVQMHLGDGGAAQNDRLFRAGFLVLVNPGALFADICDLDHIGVQTCLFAGLAERLLVHSGRAGTDDYAGQTVFMDFLLNHLLAGLGTHVLVIGGENNAGLLGKGLRDCFHIDGRGNVAAAPAYEYADSLHCVPSLLFIFAERRGNRLLRQFFVKNFRDALGLQVIHALLALHGIAHGLNEFCRLDVSGTALDAGKAAQTGVDALRGKQFLNSAVFDHGDKLMRMVFHLVIRRTACRAFAAAHALSGVHAGDAGDGFDHVLIVHASSSPQPSASASSSVK